MKRVALLLVVACGSAPSQPPQRAESSPPSDYPSAVDTDPGHDEPEEEEDDDVDAPAPAVAEPSPAVTPPRPRQPVVADDAPVLEVLRGRVSYYSDRLAGRSTASGEPYRIEEFTAASRDLPFGTLARVIRLSRAGDEELGSVIVRVNDRGPFGDHRRILDLSRAAAEALDMVAAGVVPVRVEILRRGR